MAWRHKSTIEFVEKYTLISGPVHTYPFESVDFSFGFKSFRVHIYPDTNRITPSTRIRIHSSVQDSCLNIVQWSILQ